MKKYKELSNKLYEEGPLHGSFEQNIVKICYLAIAYSYGKPTKNELLNEVLRLCAHVSMDWDAIYPMRYKRVFEIFSDKENAAAFIKGVTRPDKSIHRRLVFAIKFIEEWS